MKLADGKRIRSNNKSFMYNPLTTAGNINRRISFKSFYANHSKQPSQSLTTTNNTLNYSNSLKKKTEPITPHLKLTPFIINTKQLIRLQTVSNKKERNQQPHQRLFSTEISQNSTNEPTGSFNQTMTFKPKKKTTSDLHLMFDTMELAAKKIKKCVQVLPSLYPSPDLFNKINYKIDHLENYPTYQPKTKDNEVVIKSSDMQIASVKKSHAHIILYWDRYNHMKDDVFYRKRKEIITEYEGIEKENDKENDPLTCKYSYLTEQNKKFKIVIKNSLILRKLGYSIQKSQGMLLNKPKNSLNIKVVQNTINS